jgi:hypothetical protein
LGESAIAVNADRREVLTKLDTATVAFGATAAENVRIARDPHAGPEIPDLASDRLDDSREFVAERNRRLARKFAFKEMPVRAADSARLDANQEFVRAGQGFLRLRQRQVSDRL